MSILIKNSRHLKLQPDWEVLMLVYYASEKSACNEFPWQLVVMVRSQTTCSATNCPEVQVNIYFGKSLKNNNNNNNNKGDLTFCQMAECETVCDHVPFC